MDSKKKKCHMCARFYNLIFIRNALNFISCECGHFHIEICGRSTRYLANNFLLFEMSNQFNIK